MGRGASAGPAQLKKIGVAAATVNMLKAACGPGALGLAFASSRAGLAIGPAVLLTLQSCCVYNMHLLVRLKQHMAREGRGRNYGDLGEFVFGVKGRVAVECFVTIQQIGVCCVYFQFVSANIAAVLVTLGLDPSVTRLRRSQLMIAAYFVFAPLALIRSWKTLAPLSFIANGCIFSGIGIALAYIVPSALNTTWLAVNGDELQLSLLSESVLPPDAATTGAPLLFGAVIYSFEMICNVLPIENSMAKPERMPTVINISMAIYCTVMYVVAMLPVVAFGRITEGSLTAELGIRYTGEDDRVTVIVMNMLVVAAVTLTFPVQFYPAIEVIETRLGMRGDARGTTRRQQQGGQGGGYALVGSSDVEPDAEDPEGKQEARDPAGKDRSRTRNKGSASGPEYQQLLQEEDADEDSDGVEVEDDESDEQHEGSIYEEGAEDNLLHDAVSDENGLDNGCACLKRLCLRCACVLFAASVALAVPNLELVIVRTRALSFLFARTHRSTVAVVYCLSGQCICTLIHILVLLWGMLLEWFVASGFPGWRWQALFGSLNAPLLAMILPPVMAMKVFDGRASSSEGDFASPRLHRLIAMVGLVGCVSGTTAATMEVIDAVLI